MLHKLISLIVLISCTGCMRIHNVHIQPELFVRTSVNYQVCAKKDGTTPVIVWATRVGMPPGMVKFVVRNGPTIELYADPTAELNLARTGIGSHVVDVTSGTYQSSASWSVYDCSS